MAINFGQVEQKSFLRLKRYTWSNPIAAAANAVVASVDPSSAVTVGTALTQATAFATTAFFRHARRVTLVLTDNSFSAGSPLTVGVRITGTRFGQTLIEDLNVVCTSGSAETGTSANGYDSISSIVPYQVLNAAASDALTMGVTADLGFPYPLDRVGDVQSIYKIVSGNVETIIAVSATTVDVARAMLVHGTTITKANDVFEAQFQVSLLKDSPGIGGAGAFA